ncbi:MAG: lipid-A-disaccharide synthase [Lautropia sp.]
MNVGMVAGEASGDLLAAAVLARLGGSGAGVAEAAGVEVRSAGGPRCAGIGGPAMVAEGFEAWWPSELLAVHGYAAALKVYAGLLRIRRQLGSRLIAWPSACFVGVDAPDFNLGLELRLRAQGIRTLHFVSPSIWAWRRERIETIRRAVDRMLLVFPFEQQIYRDAGIAATYCGHPLADRIPFEPDRIGARAALGYGEHDTVIAVLPGSRGSEVAHLGPVFIAAVALLARRHRNWRFVIPAAGPERRRELDALLAARPVDADLRIVDGRSHTVLAACDVTLIASGTATLEAMLFKRPMVIAYRMAALSYRLMKSRAYLPYVGLPNILCGEFVVPELIQDAATPAALAAAVEARLDDIAGNFRLAERFAAIHRELARDCAARVAEAIQAR